MAPNGMKVVSIAPLQFWVLSDHVLDGDRHQLVAHTHLRNQIRIITMVQEN